MNAKAKTLTAAKVKETLEEAGVFFDTLSKKGDVYTARREFYYTHGNSGALMGEKVLKVFPNATVLETADVWKPFKGGANTRNSSHFLVVFKM